MLYYGCFVDVLIEICYGFVNVVVGNVEFIVKSVIGMLDYCFNDKWLFYSVVCNYEYLFGCNNYMMISCVIDGLILIVMFVVN